MTPRIPPHSEDAERQVLGACMIGRDAFDRAAPIIGSAETFYHARHAHIWRAMETLSDAGVEIDIATVAGELARTSRLGTGADQIGMNVLTEISMAVASPATVKHHAAIVRDKATLRSIARIADELAVAAYESSADPKTLIDTADQQLIDLHTRPTGSTGFSYSQLMSAVIADIEAREAAGTGMTGMASGYHDIDRMLSGFQKTHNVIIAGRPAMGKSGFALGVAEGLARNGHPGLFLSLEMSPESLGKRALARAAHVDASRIRSANLTADDWRAIHEAVRRLSPLGVHVEGCAGLSTRQMRELVRRYQRTHKIEWVVLDYLQLASAPGKKSREEEITAISRMGKSLAMEFGICWIALSQLNRQVESRGDKRPILSDLRESGSIEQDADVVMFIHRPEYYNVEADPDGNSTKGIAEIIIAKQREGPIGTVRVAFRSEWAAFENAAVIDDAPDHLPWYGGASF